MTGAGTPEYHILPKLLLVPVLYHGRRNLAKTIPNLKLYTKIVKLKESVSLLILSETVYVPIAT